LIISVLGTKGGVGKSTVAMALAIWMSARKRVLLIDGDTHVRSVELKMCPGMDATLADVLAERRSWEEAIFECDLVDKKTKEPLYPNLAIIPAGSSFIGEKTGEIIRAAARRLNHTLAHCSKEFDHVLIDTPASMGYEHLLLTAAGERIVHVCEANDDSILSAKQTRIGMERMLDIETLGVVLCKIPPDVDVGIWKRKALEVAPVLGVVPADEHVDRAFRENLPVVAAYPECPASLALKEISAKLVGRRTKGVDVEGRIDAAIERIKRVM
jgi:MinD-like ATPase involved in chromosome partitioning or flagellar assembly